MCIQTYWRCICGHREKHGAPKRCEKAKKATRTWYFAILSGPSLDGKGYCKKRKADFSVGVPEPCRDCRAQCGYTSRPNGSRLVERPDTNFSEHSPACYYDDGGSTSWSGDARGLAPLPPPKAHMSSHRSEKIYGQVPLLGFTSQPQQPNIYHESSRRPLRYESPRQPPPPPPPPRRTKTKHATEVEDKTRKQSEKHVKKTLREAEKVSRSHNTRIDDIRAQAIARAKEERHRPEPSNPRNGSTNSDYPRC